MPTKRKTYVFPEPIIKTIETISKEIIKEMNMAGKTMCGTIERDLFCIAVQIALPTIKKMDKKELEERIREIERLLK